MVVVYLLPFFAQRITHAVYDSAEMIERDVMHDARALVAQGEYHAAIEAFKEAAKAEPLNRLPWVEIAKIYKDNLEDPESAIQTIRYALESQEWEINDAAYFLFRLAELYDEVQGDRATAIAILRQVVEQFPRTRHSANAQRAASRVGRGPGRAGRATGAGDARAATAIGRGHPLRNSRGGRRRNGQGRLIRQPRAAMGRCMTAVRTWLRDVCGRHPLFAAALVTVAAVAAADADPLWGALAAGALRHGGPGLLRMAARAGVVRCAADSRRGFSPGVRTRGNGRKWKCWHRAGDG